MSVNLRKIKEMDMANLFGETVERIVGFGELASNMEREFTYLMMGE